MYTRILGVSLEGEFPFVNSVMLYTQPEALMVIGLIVFEGHKMCPYRITRNIR
jgi:hypothetical protein